MVVASAEAAEVETVLVPGQRAGGERDIRCNLLIAHYMCNNFIASIKTFVNKTLGSIVEVVVFGRIRLEVGSKV